MHDNLTTPLALLLAAALLVTISFIPQRAPSVESAAAPPALLGWVADTPLDRDEYRLALLVAGQVSVWALDRAMLELNSNAKAKASTDPIAAAATSPPAIARRSPPRGRPMMPFYSFASTSPPRSQES